MLVTPRSERVKSFCFKTRSNTNYYFHFRDSIEPLFDAQDFSFATHSVFLDSSNTPLPLAFDTFPLGGNVLHVRGKLAAFWCCLSVFLCYNK